MFNTILLAGPIPVANLLIQLIATGIADQERFSQLFHTCIDMLGVILHSLAGGDIGIHEVIGLNGKQKREPNRTEKKKIEQKIVKRIGMFALLQKKKINHFEGSDSDKGPYDALRQLIPIQKETDQRFEIVKYEKIPYNEQRKWRTGLRPVGKEKVNPWDLIEGLKEKPICLSWFGATRSDREPGEWQYRERLGQFPPKKEPEYWLHLPDLPSEDEEPPPEKLAKDNNGQPMPIQNPNTNQFNPPNMQNAQQGGFPNHPFRQNPINPNPMSQINPMNTNQGKLKTNTKHNIIIISSSNGSFDGHSK